MNHTTVPATAVRRLRSVAAALAAIVARIPEHPALDHVGISPS